MPLYDGGGGSTRYPTSSIDNPYVPPGSGLAGAGGGNPGTPTGSPSVPGTPIGENGGILLPSTWFLMVPAQNITTGACFIGFFDTSSFDDPVDGSSYSYRVEDIVPNRVPTVRRVILQYRDLGRATIIVTITGTNDQNQVISASVTQQLGNLVLTKAILTTFVDIQLTGFRPQLSITRPPGGGPISIITATMIGEVEDATL